MDLFDFFFPEQAQAKHLRQISNSQKFLVSAQSNTGEMREQVSSLQQDVRFLTLLMAGIIKRLGETQTMSLNDLQDLLDEIDALDGTPDGGLEPGVLRGLVGILRESNQEAQDATGEKFKINTSLGRRYRR